MAAKPTRRELLARRTTNASADTRILQDLAVSEQLLFYSYEHVLGSTVVDAAVGQALAPVRAAERIHLAALQARLRARGATMPAAPGSDAEANAAIARLALGGRLGQLRGAADALGLLLALERVVVGAYYVALETLADPALATLAAQIMGSDAQHETIIRLQAQPGDALNAVPEALVSGVH